MDPQISRSVPINAQAAKELEELLIQEDAMVVDTEASLDEYVDVSPFSIYQRFRDLKKLKEELPQTRTEKTTEEKANIKVENVEELAFQFQRNNEELQAKSLMILRSMVTDEDNPEEILAKILKNYPDHSLTDEALDFLIQTTEGKLKSNLESAKEKLHQDFGREVAAGRNMGTQAREFSKEGLGSATSLRDLYRDITGTPREPLKLFEELTNQFPYAKLSKVITFLLHSLGSDMKSKGPSIARPELLRLLTETRSLQGILGVFRFFKQRMPQVEKLFAFNQLSLPPQLTFESLGKMLIKLLNERFPNRDKLLQFANFLKISEKLAAQIIIFTLYRDALKQIAPQYYRNLQHRDELMRSLNDLLEDLEEEEEEGQS